MTKGHNTMASISGTELEAIRKVAERVEVIGGAVMVQGDCRDVLPVLPKVDAVVTDPPYILSDSGPGDSHQFGKSLRKFDSDAYKSIVSGFDFEFVFDAIEKLCQPFNLFCFCSNKQISSLMSYLEAKGCSSTLLVWHKVNAAPFANGVWRGDIEYCIHARGKGAVFVGGAQEKKRVSEFPLVQDDAHPTVKPLPLMRKYVGICSYTAQTILDPFMGSGTTGVAAGQMGRQFIGIEKEPKYFEIACKRIEEAQKQGDMFIEQPAQPKPQQTGLDLGDAA